MLLEVQLNKTYAQVEIRKRFFLELAYCKNGEMPIKMQSNVSNEKYFMQNSYKYRRKAEYPSREWPMARRK